ncbi:MAG: PhzF family phenazine biosynthesis protein [Bacteroidales bacterium]|nr:PhzF family phenazine biosynthesis protein [Bacteroidales bacterium]MDD2425378.1 PhzF family phenazine biosynthesis protein [Bacteroidales bacterium]MDD3988795.1 PhzF family phenazine biosynthesis protein [Bacteroidales bacterium]MDD4639627.1 PhzF family phenazine biosynthesis protein [Bacteroidales bacterium]
MVLQSFQVDAFTDRIFSGNPASVVFLEERLPDSLLMSIARENSVPETAFLLEEDNMYSLRWFTPDFEIDLCGHATLASAHVLFSWYKFKGEELLFNTRSGLLTVKREGIGYAMEFPLREAKDAILPVEIYDALNIKPREVYKARDFLLVYSKREEIEMIEVDRTIFDEINIDPGGVIVTAPDVDFDFVSRFFTPQATILEDPVTGSAHCTLAPYWAKRLKKNNLRAKQLSGRGGEIECRVGAESVILWGKAVIYSRSELYI